jgi:hypothetical protein
MYKLVNPIQTPEGPKDPKVICRIADNAFIPMDEANTDYQQFKKDLANGVVLQDATGTAMSADNIATFLATLK